MSRKTTPLYDCGALLRSKCTTMLRVVFAYRLSLENGFRFNYTISAIQHNGFKA